MNHQNILLSLAIPALLAGSGAHAFEGAQQYPLGVDNFMAGALPPAGNYFINYLGHYQGSYRGPDGDRVPGLDVSAVFDALRYIHVSKFKILGADWGVHVVVPLVSQQLETPNPGFDNDRVNGVGDITIDPLLLGWHFPSGWHVIFGVDINLPTGAYDDSDPTRSIGANYYSIQPTLATTYLHRSGFEVSTKLMYNIKGENDDTDYASGDDFHLDYLIGQHLGPWTLGVGGYYLTQTEDDEWHGHTVGPDGNRARVFAYGPAVKYDYKGMSVVATWNHETGVENYFQGDKFYLNFIVAF